MRTGVKGRNLNRKDASVATKHINKFTKGEEGAACSVLLTRYHSGDQVKKTEMSRTCSTYGGEERCIPGFSGET
jgi:hypothetical protein